MNNKGSKKAKIITIIISFLCPFLAIFFTYSAIKIYPSSDYKEYLFPILFSIIGLIGGYLVHNAVHELGHAIFAKKAKAKVFEVACCGFVFSKKKVKFKPSSAYAGWTKFVPQKPEDALNVLLTSLYGGFLGSLICLFIGILLMVFMGRSWLTLSLVCSAQMVFIYMTVINFSTGADGTDGKLFASSKDESDNYFVSKIYLLEAQSKMYAGLRAKELGEFYFQSLFEEKSATYIDLLIALENGDKTLAKDLIDQMENNGEMDDNELIATLSEKLFLACVEKEETKAYNIYEQICAIVDEPDGDLTLMRASYAYKTLTGEVDWAKALRVTFAKACAAHDLSGFGKTQLEILNLYYPE